MTDSATVLKPNKSGTSKMSQWLIGDIVKICENRSSGILEILLQRKIISNLSYFYRNTWERWISGACSTKWICWDRRPGRDTAALVLTQIIPTIHFVFSSSFPCCSVKRSKRDLRVLDRLSRDFPRGQPSTSWRGELSPKWKRGLQISIKDWTHRWGHNSKVTGNIRGCAKRPF